MGQFHTTLKTEQITEGTLLRRSKFRVLKPLIYESTVLNKIIIVPEGFITDFATVPRLPILYAFLGNLGNTAACLHDFLYTPPHKPSKHDCEQVTRLMADLVLKEAIIDGMVTCLNEVVGTTMTVIQSLKNIVYVTLGNIFFIGVRLGGSFHWKDS